MRFDVVPKPSLCLQSSSTWCYQCSVVEALTTCWADWSRFETEITTDPPMTIKQRVNDNGQYNQWYRGLHKYNTSSIHNLCMNIGTRVNNNDVARNLWLNNHICTMHVIQYNAMDEWQAMRVYGTWNREQHTVWLTFASILCMWYIYAMVCIWFQQLFMRVMCIVRFNRLQECTL